jgi:hypothetical protein
MGRNNLKVEGFEVLTAVVRKNAIFGDVTLYNPLEVSRC